MKISTPLRGKYLVKSLRLFSFLKFVDFFTFFLFRFNKKRFLKNLKGFSRNPKKFPRNPNKILLSNIAHLGDLVISTSVLPILKKKFPDCKIGFLCSSASKELIENHPLIDKIYLLDHWKLNRDSSSLFKKVFSYFKMRSKIIKKIKEDKYDVAIDLYSYFPNTIYLFWKAKIPIRIGYTSAGFKNFLTNSIDWINQDKHISEYHFDLLKFLKINEEDKKHLKIDLSKTGLFQTGLFLIGLPQTNPSIELSQIEPYQIDLPLLFDKKNKSNLTKPSLTKSSLVKTSSFEPSSFEPSSFESNSSEVGLDKTNLVKPNFSENFILIHIGAGDQKKMWDVNKWKELTSKLIEKGKDLVFTGRGKIENEQILSIIKDQKNCMNFCDKLNLNELIKIIHKAKCIICVDSVVLHLATALNKPAFVIYCGINNHHHWVLKKDNVKIVSKDLACIPCYEKNGCDTMDCLNNIQIEDVLDKMRQEI